MTCCQNCVSLAIRNDTLEEEVRQLKSALYGREWTPPEELGLTPSQELILAAMVRANTRPVSDEMLFEASRSRASTAEDLSGNLISSFICSMRKRLAPHGIQIETMKFRGYRLTPQSRALLLNWPARETQAA